MTKASAALYRGVVMHHRHQPVKHRFIYKVFAICVELQQLDQTCQKLRWFSRNRFNLFSFYDRDHGLGSDNLLQDISELLQRCDQPDAGYQVKVLCYPRILGYQFNPLTEYFCYNKAEELAVIIHEVHNTFGQRHLYLIPVNEPTTSLVRQSTDKQMYVSPFTPMHSGYRFRITAPENQVRVHIRHTDTAQKKPIMDALFQGDFQTMTDKNLIRNFFAYPLMTLKVIGAIHWEAFRLWRKKLRIQPRPAAARCSISWQTASGETLHETL
ncbi:DUF1365 domain-containing protein [Neptuniibacter sp. CAU 1671]|uniref:DUF1365 domain-containing protein n=1 Tax=Neptuniibacter sp. CAU 1671 TaxID=3032593 RepID=UPI0023DB30EA|nr:DUF1365 domain-containing protein [Neptuniibacter sp. CAU 1671]MDF2182801.1 DUF1365 domain-containing protein [Neptuniibacter sp. CAU 1671]